MGKRSKTLPKLTEIGFQKGNIPHNKGFKIERVIYEEKKYVRPTVAVFSSITEQDEKLGVLHVRDNDGCQVNVGYLRPKVNTPSILNEPPRDKTNKMTYAPSEDSDPPSLIRVFAVRTKKAWVLSYPLSAQRRL